MSSNRNCPRCGQPAQYRLGELHCPACGFSKNLTADEKMAASRDALPLDSSLVRSPSGDSGKQLRQVMGGRVMHPKVDYGSGLPSIAELGAFLTCFFAGQILMHLIVSATLGVGGNIISTIIGSAVFTMVLAFVLSQNMSCLKNAVLLMAVLLAILSIVMVWKSVQGQHWLGVAFAVYNLGISGWLASLLSRQASME